MRLCLIGGGKMGRALVQGMIAAGFVAEDSVAVGEPNQTSQAWWRDTLPAAALFDDNAAAAKGADVVLIAVKPGVVTQVLGDIQPVAGKALIVSIATGVSLKALCEAIGSTRVVRVMPNTPALVQAAASAYCFAPGVSDADRQLVANLLDAVGMSVAVDESALDAVTGVSGSGPAYICLVIEAMADGGVAAGLPRELAMQLATQTVLGTAKMVQQTGTHPGELKDAVASPGGTTIAALASLERNGLRHAMIQAVQSAAERSRQMGQ